MKDLSSGMNESPSDSLKNLLFEPFIRRKLLVE